jgi:hypothetical protein
MPSGKLALQAGRSSCRGWLLHDATLTTILKKKGNAGFNHTVFSWGPYLPSGYSLANSNMSSFSSATNSALRILYLGFLFLQLESYEPPQSISFSQLFLLGTIYQNITFFQ